MTDADSTSAERNLWSWRGILPLVHSAIAGSGGKCRTADDSSSPGRAISTKWDRLKTFFMSFRHSSPAFFCANQQR
jgi:hypothetical protein